LVQKTWSKGNPITAVKKKEKNKKFNLNYRLNLVFCRTVRPEPTTREPKRNLGRGRGTGDRDRDWDWDRGWDWDRDRGWDRD